ncbi:hypothetical protein [Cytobacillus oceanisediminis]|uniref:hypothetical protein n=1 Tax=Cytobacillus oceanisediminis TaxID=665099 RepID=UPI001C230544|nr:hypothetical protein [Cytobacillus oceanisediminis]MBU8770318.1 hypothetical protein [Cytobacillus oceanisediminis]
MKQYKKLQIIKHALQYYISRAGANDADVNSEKMLLEEITDEVDRLKERYGIKQVSK